MPDNSPHLDVAHDVDNRATDIVAHEDVAHEHLPTCPTSSDVSVSAPESQDELKILAERINRNRDASNASLFEIGQDLHAAKKKLSHREFGPWLEREFSWSVSTANRYMRAETIWGEKAELVSCLEATAIYALTAKATPEPVRLEIEQELEAGDRPSLQEIRERVKAAKDETDEKKRPDRKAKAHDAAALIIEHTADVEMRLRTLLEGADPVALVKALKAGPKGSTAIAERHALGLS